MPRDSTNSRSTTGKRSASRPNGRKMKAHVPAIRSSSHSPSQPEGGDPAASSAARSGGGAVDQSREDSKVGASSPPRSVGRMLMNKPNCIGHARLLLLFAAVVVDTQWVAAAASCPTGSVPSSAARSTGRPSPCSWLTHDEAALVAAACITLSLALDTIDGYVARLYNETTLFGHYYDVIIDCLTTVVVFALVSDAPYRHRDRDADLLHQSAAVVGEKVTDGSRSTPTWRGLSFLLGDDVGSSLLQWLFAAALQPLHAFVSLRLFMMCYTTLAVAWGVLSASQHRQWKSVVCTYPPASWMIEKDGKTFTTFGTWLYYIGFNYALVGIYLCDSLLLQHCYSADQDNLLLETVSQSSSLPLLSWLISAPRYQRRVGSLLLSCLPFWVGSLNMLCFAQWIWVYMSNLQAAEGDVVD